ncbi:MAG: PRC-barrel domain containing protein [Chloroflexi bacterium]|nr:PRC-barrel domain containing protein [Chloroflexota bacterium]
MQEEIPVNAKVICADGPCGTVSALIVNPISKDITHVVVRDKDGLNPDERLVPVELIVEATHGTISLQCTRDELMQTPSFLEHHYIPHQQGEYDAWQGGEYLSPYVTAQWNEPDRIDVEQLPTGELAIHPGARVEASDEHIGEVEEFVIDSETGHLTHLVLREGHLWGKKDVTVPLSVIESIGADTVYLNVDKKTVETYPSVKVKRHYR